MGTVKALHAQGNPAVVGAGPHPFRRFDAAASAVDRERRAQLFSLYLSDTGHKRQAGRQASLAGFLIAIKLIPGDFR